MTPAIELSALSKTYTLGTVRRKRVEALKSFTLSVQTGEVFGLLGPNGAGKSTTIKILLNLIRATSGSARIFGIDVNQREARRSVGFLPENPAPYDYLTGEEFVRLAAALSGLSSSAIEQNTRRVLEQVGMTNAASLQIRKYSKGMTQRISLAQALVGEPKLLILDEPTSGLDVLGRQLIRDIIIAERKRGATVLLCSHIIPDVEVLCDRVAVLIGGSVVREGLVSQLLSDVKTRVQVVLDSVSVEQLSIPGLDVERRNDRVEVHCEEKDLDQLLGQALAAKAKVISVNRERYTLEDLFLEAVQKSDVRVGSSIS